MVRAPCTRRRAAAGGGGTGGLAATETQSNSGRRNPACILFLPVRLGRHPPSLPADRDGSALCALAASTTNRIARLARRPLDRQETPAQPKRAL